AAHLAVRSGLPDQPPPGDHDGHVLAERPGGDLGQAHGRVGEHVLEAVGMVEPDLSLARPPEADDVDERRVRREQGSDGVRVPTVPGGGEPVGDTARFAGVDCSGHWSRGARAGRCRRAGSRSRRASTPTRRATERRGLARLAPTTIPSAMAATITVVPPTAPIAASGATSMRVTDTRPMEPGTSSQKLGRNATTRGT